MKLCAREGCDRPVVGRKYNAIYCRDACKVAASRARSRQGPSIAVGGARKPLQRLSRAGVRMIHALRRAGSRGLTTAELARPEVGGTRFGARIHEARELGYDISVRRESGSSQYLYRLIGLPPRRGGMR